MATHYYFSVNGGGDGLSANSPTTFSLAISAANDLVKDNNDEYILTESGSGGSYVFSTAPVNIGYAWSGSSLVINFLPGSSIRGTNSAGIRTSSLVVASDGAKCTLNAAGVHFQTFAALMRASRNGIVILNTIGATGVDIERLMSIGNGGRGIGPVGGDWDGRDLSSAIIANGQATLAVIGAVLDLTQPDDGYATGALFHHWNEGPNWSEGSSGHCDRLRIEDCNVGMIITRGAGSPNLKSIRFKRNKIGILTDISPLEISTGEWNLIFNTDGSSERNVDTILWTEGGTKNFVEGTNYDSRPIFQARSLHTQNTVTSTNENFLWNPFSVLPQGARAGDVIEIFNSFYYSNSLSGGAVWKIYFGEIILLSINIENSSNLNYFEIELWLQVQRGASGNPRGPAITVVGSAWLRPSNAVPIHFPIPTTAALSATDTVQIQMTMQLLGGSNYRLRAARAKTSICGLTM